MRHRIGWVDYLKGIAILLVIVGHTISNFYIRTFIFSFHMPLFFFLSGYTSLIDNRGVSRKENLKRISIACKRLLVPAYVIWVIRILAYYFVQGEVYSVKQYILSAVYASGVAVNLGSIEVPAFGMMWFLVVLFFSKLICDFVWQMTISIAIRHTIFIILCFIGMIVSIKLPFSFDVVLVAMIFYHAGKTIRCRKDLSGITSYVIGAGIMWSITLVILFTLRKHFELATRNYPFYFLSIIMALSACFFICSIIERLNHRPIEKTLKRIGYNSMTLFTIHAFDTVWYPFIQKRENKAIVLLARLGIDLLLLFFIVLLRDRIYKSLKEKHEIDRRLL